MTAGNAVMPQHLPLFRKMHHRLKRAVFELSLADEDLSYNLDARGSLAARECVLHAWNRHYGASDAVLSRFTLVSIVGIKDGDDE